MKNMWDSKWNVIIMLVIWRVLLRCRIITGVINNCLMTSRDITDNSERAIFSTLMLGMIILYTIGEEDRDKEGLGISWKDDADEGVILFLLEQLKRIILRINYSLKGSLYIILMLSGVFLSMRGIAEWYGWNFLEQEVYIEFVKWNIRKKYLFDIIMTCVFPFWSVFIIRKVKENNFSIKAVVSGSVQILLLTLTEFALYTHIGNDSLAEMAFMNIVTLIVIIKRDIWAQVKKKNNIIALLSVYGVFWILLLSRIYHPGQTIITFLNGDIKFDLSNSNSYISNVKNIIQNASFMGKSSILTSDSCVMEFMQGRTNPLLTALVYKGWLAGIGLIILEIIFVAVTALVLLQNKRKDEMGIVLEVTWISLATRVVVGVMYSFGVPIPRRLPFTSEIRIIADSIAIGLLLINYIFKRIYDFGDDEEEIDDWDEL